MTHSFQRCYPSPLWIILPFLYPPFEKCAISYSMKKRISNIHKVVAVQPSYMINDWYIVCKLASINKYNIAVSFQNLENNIFNIFSSTNFSIIFPFHFFFFTFHEFSIFPFLRLPLFFNQLSPFTFLYPQSYSPLSHFRKVKSNYNVLFSCNLVILPWQLRFHYP